MVYRCIRTRAAIGVLAVLVYWCIGARAVYRCIGAKTFSGPQSRTLCSSTHINICLCLSPWKNIGSICKLHLRSMCFLFQKSTPQGPKVQGSLLWVHTTLWAARPPWWRLMRRSSTKESGKAVSCAHCAPSEIEDVIINSFNSFNSGSLWDINGQHDNIQLWHLGVLETGAYAMPTMAI